MAAPRRPKVICHMVPSLDGRIVLDGWPVQRGLHAEYERTAETFEADAWIIGRVSMEPYAGRAPLPKRSGPVPRTDYVAPSEATSYAVAIDPSGKLRWKSGDIDGEQVIAVLTTQVPDRYLAFLRAQGVSYVFGGKSRIDLPRVLEKLRALFGIRTLLLEGGGKINGSFLKAGVIDELSILVAPVADGRVGRPSLFDSGRKGPARGLALISAEGRGDLVWLRYKVKKGKS